MDPPWPSRALREHAGRELGVPGAVEELEELIEEEPRRRCRRGQLGDLVAPGSQARCHCLRSDRRRVLLQHEELLLHDLELSPRRHVLVLSWS